MSHRIRRHILNIVRIPHREVDPCSPSFITKKRLQIRGILFASMAVANDSEDSADFMHNYMRWILPLSNQNRIHLDLKSVSQSKKEAREHLLPVCKYTPAISTISQILSKVYTPLDPRRRRYTFSKKKKLERKKLLNNKPY